MIDAAAVTDWRRRHRAAGLVEHSACQLLRRLAAQVPTGQEIVELGAYRGRSTGWLLLGAQDGHGAHVTSVDPWESRTGQYVGRVRGADSDARAAFAAHMRRIGADGTTLAARQGYAADVAAEWCGPVGLLWHDAGHGADEVEADLRAWVPHVAPGGVVVLHDASRRDYGVVAGAARVLDAPGWDWPGELIPWARKPWRRGVLVVRRGA